MKRLVVMFRSVVWILAAIPGFGFELAGAGEITELPPPEKFHLYVLAGQSNMAGRGVVEDQDRIVHPRVLMLNKDNRWVPAVDPMHFDKPGVGVGPGKSFGLMMAEANPEVTIGLIPCAAGGSPIETWQPGGFHSQTRSHPWDDAIRRARIVANHGQIKAILWHQGESDCSQTLAPEYEHRLHDLIARFRTELKLPQVPFLAGQMGQFSEQPWDQFKRQVDAAHQRLPQVVPATAFISSDGLSHKGDRIHFDSASCRELGRRYARALQGLSAE
ncbi:MAG: sialate O-acetylesterase [Planctomycetaceae bacterium]